MRFNAVSILLALFASQITAHSTTIYAATDKGLLASSDSGRSWAINGSLGPVRVDAIGADPSDPARLFVASRGDIFRTTDAGRTWERAGNPPPGSVSILSVDPVWPDRVYAAGEALWTSTDGGKQWQLASRLAARFLDFAIDPLQPLKLYAAVNGAGIFISSDGGTNWVYATGGPLSRLSVIVKDSRTSAYAGSPEGISRSADGGKTWALAAPPPSLAQLGVTAPFQWSGDIEVFDPVVRETKAFAVDPGNPDRMYLALTTCFDVFWSQAACGRGIFSRSAQGWSPYAVEANAATFVAGTEGEVYFANSLQILRSTNAGQSWASLLPIQANSPAMVVVGDEPRITGIRNAAAPEMDSLLAPGAIVSIFGRGLSSGLGQSQDDVLVNGSPVALYFVSPEQINAVLPLDLWPEPAIVEVRAGTRKSLPRSVEIVRSAPALFSLNNRGTGPGVFTHAATGDFVTSSAPAIPGETILGFATGLGDSAGLRATVGNLAATIEGSPLPAGVTGVWAIRMTVPKIVAGDMQPVRLFSGDWVSNIVEVACANR